MRDVVVSYWARGIFAAVFVIVVIILARIFSTYGQRFLNRTFKGDEALVRPVHVLLNLGFYLLCIGLLLWNVGVADSNTSGENVFFQVFEDVAFRLGVSIFVVGAFHCINILVLAILNRKNS